MEGITTRHLAYSWTLDLPLTWRRHFPYNPLREEHFSNVNFKCNKYFQTHRQDGSGIQSKGKTAHILVLFRSCSWFSMDRIAVVGAGLYEAGVGWASQGDLYSLLLPMPPDAATFFFPIWTSDDVLT